MLDLKDVIFVHPDMQSGEPVFKGTRVPVYSLFMHLEEGVSLDEFLDDFPSVTREQAIAVLEWSKAKIYEAAA
ncbi:MAG TPA: DUF433 domain-containing protein [Chitinophagales bacterium]|nr:DUF433 domain-containing protein [Chitinophagales bacterium]